MRQVYRVLSTYSADAFGIASALYELGGLVIIHDASGCNSTYNTHDEPRWYDMDSLFYVSGLTESDAILGRDDILVDNILEVCKSEHPNFVAMCGSPVPMFMGTDFVGIAKEITALTDIPAFGYMTNGINTYIKGAGHAFKSIAQTFVLDNKKALLKDGIKINILGFTPLDFYDINHVKNIMAVFEKNDISIISNFAMGNTLEDISKAAMAHVNVVVSATGLLAAKFMKEKYDIPYVCGIPMGISGIKRMINKIKEALDIPYSQDTTEYKSYKSFKKSKKVLVIGEAVYADSIKYCLSREFGYENIKILSPFEENCDLLSKDDSDGIYEDDAEKLINEAELVIADPLYKRVLHEENLYDTDFVSIPHIAYSGRYYQEEIPLFAGEDFSNWICDKV
ncbi:Nitrogenase molybdenum-iron protein, alpha and beta chains [Acetitomaculum ruminis DSM 5522]|uniref:Nitrogenase molybdenum-iron protein, alpha and beta chains n=1 Tax=Acetitomaculum ruminis DSM 5522 TaxID=1120918 RepID=A0A1I0Z7L3_9FIRM|nr:nitrogenase component 1 [Acetitomaculum ruminis]SFB21337.1 Nitrogenase molybdenum-iron protein, alpha and beta chains [Acetitomaculum ruminis DSM 5522]